MPSSNRGAFGRGNGTITVIQEPVMRAYRRKAKIVFYVTWVITATVAASPISGPNGGSSKRQQPYRPRVSAIARHQRPGLLR